VYKYTKLLNQDETIETSAERYAKPTQRNTHEATSTNTTTTVVDNKNKQAVHLIEKPKKLTLRLKACQEMISTCEYEATGGRRELGEEI
jgi:hypothetical protein